MKRISLIIIISVCAVGLFARPYSALELTVDGGYSTIFSQAPDASRTGGFGYGAHFGYAFYFNNYIGLGTGVDFHRYAGGIRRQWQETAYGTLDSDGETCDITSHYDATTRSSLLYVEIPLAIKVRVPVQEKIYLLFSVGAKYGIAVGGNYTTNGTTTSSAYYDQWHMTIDDIYEFGTPQTFDENGPLTTHGNAFLFGRFDVGFKVAPGFSILVGANIQAGLLNAADIPNTTGASRPFSVNLEAGFRYVLPNLQRRSRCMCEED